MKLLAAAITSLSLLASASAQTNQTSAAPTGLTPNDVRAVAPALERYGRERVMGDVWRRPGLAPRDRSIVTLAALIARNHVVEMPTYLNLALDNGVTPREVSEVITHLAFYSGWGNAMSAVAVAKEIFAQRGIGSNQLPPAEGRP